MSHYITEQIVTYWAVSGERWCNVTGYLNEKTAADWIADGWRLVTRVTEREVPVFGEVEKHGCAWCDAEERDHAAFQEKMGW